MDEFYKEIDRLFRAGKSEEAGLYMETYLAQLDADPSTPVSSKVAVLNELGGWARGVSRYDQSQKAFERALELMEDEGAVHTSAYARILLNLAGLYRMAGDQQKAIDAFEKAKGILSADGIDDPYGYVSTVNGLSLAYQEIGDLDKALALGEETLSFLQECLQVSDFEFATSYVNIANVYLKLNELEKAQELIDRAIVLFRTMEKESTHLSAALAARAVIHYRRKGFEEAARDFRESMDISSRYFGRNADYASSAKGLAMSLEALGDNKGALEAQKQSYEAFKATLGDFHQRTLEAEEYLKRLEENRGEH